MQIKIGESRVGENARPYFIADIAANHDGDINRAFRLIELAKEAGADAAKFQNFTAERIVSANGFSDLGQQRSHQASWKKSVFDTYQDASLPEEWSIRLKQKCDETGIEYMTSPYDFQAADWAEQFVSAYKIGSGDITWTDFLEHIAKKGKPVLLATGASDLTDVTRAVTCIQKYNTQLVLMQCNTNYTASEQNFSSINLNVLKTYQSLFPCVPGLSDHTYGHATVLGALALGARVFEKHFTDDNNRTGPDHKFSMNPKAWREMVKAAMQLYEALGDGAKKVEQNEQETVVLQRRALYVKRDVKAGEILTKEAVYPLRPAKENGILPYEWKQAVGRRAKHGIEADTCLLWEDIE